MNHIVDTCPLTKFEGRLYILHEVDDDAVICLESTATAALTHTHTHISFNGPFSGTTQVTRYQKGKTNVDFTDTRDSEWQWHQLGHMQVCAWLQTDNHASTRPLSFFTGRMLFLPPSQQHQSTEYSSTEGSTHKIIINK